MKDTGVCMTLVEQWRFLHDQPRPNGDALHWRMSWNCPFQRGCLVTRLTLLAFCIGGCTYA